MPSLVRTLLAGLAATAHFAYEARAHSPIFDFNDDGVADSVQNYPSSHTPAPSPGRVDVRSGSSGAVLYVLVGRHAGDAFGHVVQNNIDLDGDGRADLLVLAPNVVLGNRLGSLSAYSGATGSYLFRVSGAHGRFGIDMRTVPDQDEDGADDVIVRWFQPLEDGRWTDTCALLSGRTGAHMRNLSGDLNELAAFANAGGALHVVSDVDMNGIVDHGDLSLATAWFMQSQPPIRLDLNRTGLVDEFDLTRIWADIQTSRRILDGFEEFLNVHQPARVLGFLDTWQELFPHDQAPVLASDALPTSSTLSESTNNCPGGFIDCPRDGSMGNLVTVTTPPGTQPDVVLWDSDTPGWINAENPRTYHRTLIAEPAVVQACVNVGSTLCCNECWTSGGPSGPPPPPPPPCHSHIFWLDVDGEMFLPDDTVVCLQGRVPNMTLQVFPPGGYAVVMAFGPSGSYSELSPAISSGWFTDAGTYTVRATYCANPCACSPVFQFSVSVLPDCDRDGVLDSVESPEDVWCSDFDQQCQSAIGGMLGPIFEDTDRDGLPLLHEVCTEAGLGFNPTDPARYDTDGDHVPDLAELELGTDPRNRDSDGDHVSDAREGGPLGWLTWDLDRDGLYDEFEREVGLDPTSYDSDGDGVSDLIEVLSARRDPVHAEHAGFYDLYGGSDGDQDNDGLLDSIERIIGTSVAYFDTDRDGLPDLVELQLGTNPLSPDSDQDGLIDREEDADGDDLTNFEEVVYGTDLLLADTDGDGAPDGLEVAQLSIPTDPSDHGLPIPEEQRVCVKICIGDSEGLDMWALNVGPVSMRHPSRGDVTCRYFPFRRGQKYPVEAVYAGNNRPMPCFHYTATVETFVPSQSGDCSDGLAEAGLLIVDPAPGSETNEALLGTDIMADPRNKRALLYIPDTQYYKLETSGDPIAIDSPLVSHPTPTIHLQGWEVGNPRASPDGKRLLVDVSIAGSVLDQASNLIPGAAGSIDALNFTLNGHRAQVFGSSEPFIVPVVATKGQSGPITSPYPYSGSFHFSVQGLDVQHGWNTLQLSATNLHGLSGFTEVDFRVEAARPVIGLAAVSIDCSQALTLGVTSGESISIGFTAAGGATTTFQLLSTSQPGEFVDPEFPSRSVRFDPGFADDPTLEQHPEVAVTHLPWGLMGTPLVLDETGAATRIYAATIDVDAELPRAWAGAIVQIPEFMPASAARRSLGGEFHPFLIGPKGLEPGDFGPQASEPLLDRVRLGAGPSKADYRIQIYDGAPVIVRNNQPAGARPAVFLVLPTTATNRPDIADRALPGEPGASGPDRSFTHGFKDGMVATGTSLVEGVTDLGQMLCEGGLWIARHTALIATIEYIASGENVFDEDRAKVRAATEIAAKLYPIINALVADGEAAVQAYLLSDAQQLSQLALEYAPVARFAVELTDLLVRESLYADDYDVGWVAGRITGEVVVQVIANTATAGGAAAFKGVTTASVLAKVGASQYFAGLPNSAALAAKLDPLIAGIAGISLRAQKFTQWCDDFMGLYARLRKADPSKKPWDAFAETLNDWQAAGKPLNGETVLGITHLVGEDCYDAYKLSIDAGMPDLSLLPTYEQWNQVTFGIRRLNDAGFFELGAVHGIDGNHIIDINVLRRIVVLEGKQMPDTAAIEALHGRMPILPLWRYMHVNDKSRYGADLITYHGVHNPAFTPAKLTALGSSDALFTAVDEVLRIFKQGQDASNTFDYAVAGKGLRHYVKTYITDGLPDAP